MILLLKFQVSCVYFKVKYKKKAKVVNAQYFVIHFKDCILLYPTRFAEAISVKFFIVVINVSYFMLYLLLFTRLSSLCCQQWIM